MLRTTVRAIPLIFACCVACQAAEERPQFEVAVVKASPPPEQPSMSGGPGSSDPGRWAVTGLPLYELVNYAFAFNLRLGQFVAPAWMKAPRYDLVTKVPRGATREQMRLMLQVLLEERFKLTYHNEMREIAVYELVVAKGGPKLRQAGPDPKLAKTTTAGPAPPLGGRPALQKVDRDGFPIIADGFKSAMMMEPGEVRIRSHGHTMQDIAGLLTGQVGRQVIDKTGLKGTYDYTLAFNPSGSAGIPAPPPGAEGVPSASEPPSTPGVTIFGAVQQQLGLKLVSGRAAVDVFVVDNASRVPTAN